MLSTLFSEPLLLIAWLAAIIIALSVHEFAHAAAGTWLGDETAKRMGRLTLNPLAHVDWLGFFSLLLIGFGWGKPVPFNPYNLRNQRWGPVAIALAGPASNAIMAILFGSVLRLIGDSLGPSNLLAQFLFLGVALNVALALFNLIPIPPLDGSKLLYACLRGPHAARTQAWLESRGSMLLLGIILADAVLGLNAFAWLSRAIEWVTGRILG